ncbi:hypothetical protein DNX69_09045 [Rhodopseudomonas palustris]|uniref:DUF3443 family protein n=1 Tax=Rhodopseudomonas palustris TaxID=1076 RepID=A0A323UHT3_RHOPL|nr:hypothetical protein DNX69_09045 [Rhodopseudomonas palustris]
MNNSKRMRFSRCASAVIAVLLAISPFAFAASSSASPDNVVPIKLGFPPHGGFNRVLVSVTVCKPGTSQCATVNDVMIDTGSTGLRLQASALPAGFRLPDAVGPDRRALAECLHFVGSRAWGGVVRADVRFGGLTAQDIPIQVVGEAAGPQPDSCPGGGAAPTSNGTLGIGIHATDCGKACVQSSRMPLYYGCDAGACTPLTGAVDPAYRLPNPVTRLPAHANGVVIDFPKGAPGGDRMVSGTLTFGVGTAANNQIGPARRLLLGDNGRFTTVYQGQAFAGSYIDSGTETYIVPDAELPRCRVKTAGFCPAADTAAKATLIGRDQSALAVDLAIGNYERLRNPSIGASDRLALAAAPASTAFVWGAPFFLGKRISVLIEGRAIPGEPQTVGPMYGIAAH